MSQRTLNVDHLQLRKNTTAGWNSTNPVLLNGEIGIEIDARGGVWVKVGDGQKAWSSLPYTNTNEAKQARALLVSEDLGSLAGKTIAEFREMLLQAVTDTGYSVQRTVVFSAEPRKLITNWNTGNDYFVITDGGKQSVSISNSISSSYASLEWWSYYPGVHYRCILNNGVWNKWEKILETKDGTFKADSAGTADIARQAIRDDNGNVISSTYATKTDVANSPKNKLLTFTGAVTGSYDGSSAVSITIPTKTPIVISNTEPITLDGIWYKDS